MAVLDALAKLFGGGGRAPGLERPVYKAPRAPALNEADLLSRVEHLVSDEAAIRTVNHYRWFVNAAYYAGAQWVSWDPTLRSFREPRAPPHRVRLTINRMLVAVQMLQAKILSNRPKAQVIPASKDDADYAATEAGDAILDSEQARLGMAAIYEEVVLWMLVTGNAFVYGGWDQSVGPDVAVPDQDTGEASFSPRGEILAEVVSPFEMVVPAGITQLHQALWVGRQAIRSVEEVRRQFPETAADLVADESLSDTSMYVHQLQGLMGPEQSYSPQTVKGYALVQQTWEKRDALTREELEKWPHGRVITAVKGKLLSEQDWPFFYTDASGARVDFGLPFAHFGCWPTPGRFWRQGILDQLSPLARHYNRMRSLVAENANLHGRPYWMAQAGSGFGKAKVDAEPGRTYFYAPGAPIPQQIAPPAISSAGIESVINRDLEDLDTISGISDVSRGDLGKGASGVAINLLIEADNTRIGPVIHAFERSYAHVGKMILERVRQFWLESRATRVLGEDAAVTFDDFTGADLRDCVDVRVVEGSAMPISRMARNAEILDYVEKNVIPLDDETLPQVWGMLGLADVKKLYLLKNPDLAKARYENNLLRRGQQLLVLEWEGHPVHLVEHYRVMKGPGWDRMSPPAQEAFMEHVRMHEEAVATQAQPEGLPEAGAGPPPGGSEPPGAMEAGLPSPEPVPPTPAPLPGLGPIPGVFAPQVPAVQAPLTEPPGGFPYQPV